MLADWRNNLTAEEENRLAKNLLLDLPSEDLSQPQVLTNWQKRAWVAVIYSLSLAAHNLSRILKKKLPFMDPATADKYKPIAVWLYYAAFDDLSQAELEDFFREQDFTLVLDDEDFNDLVDKFKLRLVLEPLEERDAWREKIYNALHENDNILSKNFIAPDGRGSIMNWLKEYDKEIGVDVAETIKRAEFENQSNIKSHLDDIDKSKLKKLLNFYEFIKTTSYDHSGFEDTMVVDFQNKEYLIDNGEQIDLSRVESELKPILSTTALSPQPSTTPPSAAVQVAKSALDLGPIAAQARALLLQTRGEAKILYDRLDMAVRNSDRGAGLALLLLLAQLRQLDNLLADDERFRALVAADLKASGQDDMVEGLRLNPTAPNFVARFLKVVLRDKLGLPEIDALYFAEKLGLVLAVEGEKYGKIVMRGENGGLRWNL